MMTNSKTIAVFYALRQWASIKITTIGRYIQRFIAPSYCVGCRFFLSNDTFLCKPCLGSICPLATATIPLTKKYTARVHALSFYREPLVSLVWAKYYSHRLAAEQLGVLLWERTNLSYIAFDYIVPVPLHWGRYAWRWYNQSELIAHTISRKSGKPVIPLVKRVLYQKPQASLTSDKRSDNMTGAFMLTDEAFLYKGKKFLVIDDVMTSGSTIRQVLYCLTKLSPEKLEVAVICRASGPF